jgi:hypothetical protein
MNRTEQIRSLKLDCYYSEMLTNNYASIRQTVSFLNQLGDNKYFTKTVDIDGVKEVRVYRYI